jgi:hypothetical protein
VSDVEATDEQIFVQHICDAISRSGNSGKLNGLMVAGYTGGVSVSVAKNIKHPIKTLHQVQDPAKDRISAGDRMHPTWTALTAGTDAEKSKALEALKEYTKRKQVFILEGGVWKLGKLWEYTDKDQWKDLLKTVE